MAVGELIIFARQGQDRFLVSRGGSPSAILVDLAEGRAFEPRPIESYIKHGYWDKPIGISESTKKRVLRMAKGRKVELKSQRRAT